MPHRLTRALRVALVGFSALLSAGVVPAAAAEDEAPAPRSLPKLDLTPQILYQFLLAEIAGHRGSLGLSVSAYLDLAKSTRDPRIARRAAEIAFFSRQIGPALEAARLWVELEPDSSQARQTLAGLLVAAMKFLVADGVADQAAAQTTAHRSRCAHHDRLG